MTERVVRPRRSCLSVPGSSPKMLAKGPTLPADEVFMDLEDSVAPMAKEEARANVIQALKEGDWTGKTVVVRVNDVSTKWCYRDVIEVVENANGAQARTSRVQAARFALSVAGRPRRAVATRARGGPPIAGGSRPSVRPSNRNRTIVLRGEGIAQPSCHGPAPESSKTATGSMSVPAGRIGVFRLASLGRVPCRARPKGGRWTSMSSVPMQEMATGTDILMVRQDIDLVKKDIEVLGAKLREEMHRGFRNQTIALCVVFAALDGVILAVLKFG